MRCLMFVVITGSLIVSSCVLMVAPAPAQDKVTRGERVAPEGHEKPDSLKGTFTLAAIYSSNVSYYGQVTAESLPYVLANATYRFPWGLSLSAGSYKLLNQGSGLSETDLGAGFDYAITKKLNASVAYTHSFFPSNSPLLQAANQNNLNFTATQQWSWLKAALTADYAFGQERDVFVGMSASRSIDIGQLFDGNDLVSVEPALEVIAGTQHFFTTYTIRKGKSKNAKEKTTTVPANSFDVLAYNFRLPLSYSRSSYMAEISYQFSVLGRQAQTEASRQQSFFGVGLYYQF